MEGCTHDKLRLLLESGELNEFISKLDEVKFADFQYDDGYTLLHLVIEERNKQILRHVLRKSGNLNQPGPNGWTPLHYASNLGDLEICSELIDAGAMVDAPAKIDEKNTPLMEAAAAGNSHICELLIKMGADPKKKNDFGDTFMDIARSNGYIHFEGKFKGYS